MHMKARRWQMRRILLQALFHQLQVIWPILSGVVLTMLGIGFLIAHIEGWQISDALYFTFVTGLTIGYGDLTPQRGASRFRDVPSGVEICSAGVTG